jgi:hypothetical protein
LRRLLGLLFAPALTKQAVCQIKKNTIITIA